MNKAITLTAVLFITAFYTSAQIIHVPGDQPTIQAGIGAASDGDTVLVDPGTYLENINYYGKAITVASHWLMEQDSAHIYNTIIDGSEPVLADFASTVTFLTGEDTTSILCGFTVTGGTGMYLSTDDARVGGGIVCYYASAKIIHNIITGNEVNYSNNAWGGGIACIKENGDYWTIIEDNRIHDNHAVSSGESATGGGLEIWGNARVNRNIIENNHSSTQTGYSGGGGITHASVNNPPDTLYFKNNVVRNNSTSAPVNFAFGGGFLGNQSVIFITDCEFEANLCEGGSETSGGAIRVYAGDVTMTSNLIHSNSVVSFNNAALGGGVSLWFCNSYLSENVIGYNSAIASTQADGGAIHFWNSGYTKVENNVITNNKVVANDFCWGAGVICFEPNDRLIFSKNEFSYNSCDFSVTGLGGGLGVSDANDHEVIIDANRFMHNSVTSGGGLFLRSSYNLRLTNNLITNNETERGGAMIFYHPAREEGLDVLSRDLYRPALINNTIYANKASDHSAAIYLNCASNIPVIFNNIFYDNTSGDGSFIYNNSPSDTLVVSYSDIDETKIIGAWEGEGNINEEPDFQEGDTLCHLNGGSQCQDTGVETLDIGGIIYYCPDHDYEGDPRPAPYGPPDIGADEHFYVGINKSKFHPESSGSNFNLQVAPNPSSGISDIRYQISDIRYVRLEVFDIHGQKIKRLINAKQVAGEHIVQFNGSRLPAGIYFVRLEIGGVTETEKLVLINDY